MTLATVIQKAAIRPRYLAIVTGQVLLRGWIVHSANAFKLPSSYSFQALFFSALTLTLRTSIALVEANAGSWFQDIDGTVYVKPPAGQSIYTESLRGRVVFNFGKEPTILDNLYYEPRLANVPALSLRIEPRFGGVGQIGTGTCSFINTDGFFDSKADVRWSSVQFLVGADTPTSTAASGDYVAFGFWKVKTTRRTGRDFQMDLLEPKAVLNNKIPSETFQRADYPALADGDVGKTIPRVYGKVFGATPVCVDAGTKRFKVASHAIYEFSEVRILKDNVWLPITFATVDPALAEFTLGAEWDANQTVSVDFTGRIRADGKPMFNASEICQDVLTYLGETSFDAAAFTAAYNSLDVGAYESGLRRTVFKPSLYIDSPTPALDLIDKLNTVASSFLYVNENGQWHYEVLEPKRLADVDSSYTDQDICLGTLMTPVETADVFSQVSVTFAERIAEKWSQTISVNNPDNQYAAESSSPVLKQLAAPLFDQQDAIYFAQRLLSTSGQPLVKNQFAVKWKGILLKPGRQIQVSSDRLKIYGVLEVIEARHDLDSNRINLVCGDRRAWNDSFGWWVSDADPNWNAAGDAVAKREASESSGFWHGDDNLAGATDPNSFKVSRFW